MYPITQYTKDKAKEVGLEVKQSHNPMKKIDVFNDGRLIASIGQKNAKDYPTYIIERGQNYANERRRLYHLRHTKDTLNELLSKYLLW
jgi:hypothetical protein